MLILLGRGRSRSYGTWVMWRVLGLCAFVMSFLLGCIVVPYFVCFLFCMCEFYGEPRVWNVASAVVTTGTALVYWSSVGLETERSWDRFSRVQVYCGQSLADYRVNTSLKTWKIMELVVCIVVLHTYVQPIVTDGGGQSVDLSRSWALQKLLNWSRCHFGCGLGCDQGTM